MGGEGRYKLSGLSSDGVSFFLSCEEFFFSGVWGGFNELFPIYAPPPFFFFGGGRGEVKISSRTLIPQGLSPHRGSAS